MVRPVSFKKATKAEKDAFFNACVDAAMARAESLAEKMAKERLPYYLGENLSLKSIEMAFGHSHTWMGVPVTPDQFKALEKSRERSARAA